MCGVERNYVRCDDVPIVYTRTIDENNSTRLCICNSNLSVPFDVRQLTMRTNGRIYYPAAEKYGGIGLIASDLAIRFGALFIFNDENREYPTHIRWNGEVVALDPNSCQMIE